MSNYAIIQLVGKQYQVAAGDMLVVSSLENAVGDTITVSDVLFVADGDTHTVGAPLVKDATVTLKVAEQGRDKKIRVATYKAKSRYRKVRGHRQNLTTLEVVSIAS